LTPRRCLPRQAQFIRSLIVSTSENPFEKLHLGCGVKNFPGYYHVDALAYDHVDHVGPVEKLDFIPDGAAGHIYACHVLEHFGRKEYMDVLCEWRRVLRSGGTLRIAVPDYEACAKLYCEGRVDLPVITGLMMGGQRDEYDFHKMVFDEKSLTAALKEAGFASVTRWDWRTTDHADVDDYSQAYLPHMDKENGTLVSLNLEATA
jgi:predicted SAM-dependent methyltransferase